MKVCEEAWPGLSKGIIDIVGSNLECRKFLAHDIDVNDVLEEVILGA